MRGVGSVLCVEWEVVAGQTSLGPSVWPTFVVVNVVHTCQSEWNHALNSNNNTNTMINYEYQTSPMNVF